MQRLTNRYQLTHCASVLMFALCAAMSPTYGQNIVTPGTDPLDWPIWQGPVQDHTSPATNLPAEWDPRGGEGSNLLWKNEDLGGRSTPIVMNGKLYTLTRNHPGTDLEGEKVVCLDAATGKKLWEYEFNVYLSDVPDTRVGWSSVVGDPETGRVYALGVCGYFCCLDGETGKLEWDRSLHEEYGLLSTYGGRTNFPLIYEDTVIISAVVIGWGDTPQWGLLAKPAHRFMAFDKKSGELRWLKGTTLIPHDTTYSTPTLTTLGGKDALVFGSGDGKVWAMQAGTGLPIWSYELSGRGLNVAPQVTKHGKVITGHSEENTVGNTMGAMVALDGNATSGSASQEIWKNYEVMAGKSSPLIIDNRVYVVDDRAKLFVFDLETGEQIAKKALGTVQRSTPLYADGKIYVCTNNGRWYTLKPTEDGVEVLHKMRISGQSSDGSPIAAQGRIYIPMSDGLYCIGTEASIEAAKNSKATLASESSEDASIADQPAHLQVVPYDSLVAPGDTKEVRVRVYNAQGEYIRDAKSDELSFVVTGPGSITSDGTYTAPEDAAHQSALVTCTMGELKGDARIRIVPELPWKFDFEQADDVPLTWVGGRIRYVVREGKEGNHYIAKPTELPTKPGAPTTKLGTRSQMWMGSPEMSDYTIQADVQMTVGKPGVEGATEEDVPEFPSESADGANATLPTIGVINSCYTFALFGPNQEVRLYSWCTHPERTQGTLSKKLEPGKWYTLKLKVVPEGDHAHVMGKVWERGTDEPSDWTLEFVDKAPNLQGAPGLFGDSKVAEAYVDNIEVTEN
ncbi:PQQ-binding-like beta-propeller repeat protein [Aeoliella mucimassa]|uniref:Outer membrane biogenesis protein BamB n=1 Tax=Aeoliella mucimassa TaxID=2527972 RepID=A0A518AWC1_9BACT|nr:PQQ-binding-like beta-propeller repeat protein [Aeoliella mucimassa]QDU59018.1 outer membrane biogenesis protein BamB [Aeoliella mucimassa]